ncbi:MAG TPA: S9 family peptidase, partial [Acidobacteriaceae bacterium]
MTKLSFFLAALAIITPALAQNDLKYQLPPEAMVKLVDAAPTPLLSLSPAHAAGPRRTLIEQSASLPTIADLAEPELRLAGLRFNPKANAQSRTRYFISLKLQELPLSGAKTAETSITGLPAHPHILYPQWSPDGRHIAFANQEPAGLSLWIIDVARAHAAPVPGLRLNSVLTTPLTWLNDTALAVLATPAARGPEPKHSDVPTGPTVEENLGKATPAPTYEDLLKTPYDEAVFTYFAAAQIEEVRLSGEPRKIGKPGVFASLDSSPDGKYLLAEELHTPFSYHQPYDRFPTRRSVYTVATGASKVLDDAPLIDNLPIDRDAVEPGPREFGWRNDQPATVAFVKAADGGDPKKESAIRDRVYQIEAPFTTPGDLVGQAKVIAELPIRFRGIEWGNDHLAIVTEMRWKDRRLVLAAIDPATAKITPLYEGSMQDRYHNPGSPMLERNAQGKLVLQTTADGNQVYFSGSGASPKGDEPFVALMPVNSGPKPQETRIWQSRPPYYEITSAVLPVDSG